MDSQRPLRQATPCPFGAVAAGNVYVTDLGPAPVVKLPVG
jgi:hypothetical protein